MTKRYRQKYHTKRPDSWNDSEDHWHVDGEDYLAKTVHVEDERQWSGLYDKDGKKLIRAKQPIGFVRKSNDG